MGGLTPDGVLAIFDLDLTLIDSRKAIAGSFKRTLRRMGAHMVSEREIYSMIGIPLEQMFRSRIGEEKIKEACKSYREDFAKTFATGTKPMPGTRRMLARLKRSGVKLAIFTTKKTEIAIMVLRHLGLLGSFDAVAGSYGFKPKPNPEAVYFLIKRLGRPNRTVFVGDSPMDVETAKNAGIPCIVVGSGSKERIPHDARGISFIKNIGELDEKEILRALGLE